MPTTYKTNADLIRGLNLHRTIINSTSYIFVSTDCEGMVTFFNSAAEKALGYKAEDIIGKSTPALWHSEKEVIERAKTLTQELGRKIEPGFEVFVSKIQETGSSQESEWTFIRKDKSTFVGLLVATPIFDIEQRLTGYLGVISDITKHKKMVKDLQLAKKEADEANHAKSNFLAVMSHEIRTPMNGIIGFTTLLQETSLNEDQKEYIESIQTSGKNLLSIVNDILDYSKIEAGKLDLFLQPFSLQALIGEMRTLFNFKLLGKGIELEEKYDSRLEAIFVGDLKRIRQILINLLGNAIKFTEKGKVLLKVELMDRGGDGDKKVRISVHDTGIGIPKDKLILLFRSFSQVDNSSTRKFEGTGLGLAISRRLVELMGGEIGCNSVFGKGSEFWFTIPYLKDFKSDVRIKEEIKTDPPPTFIPREDHNAKLKFLIVEDNASNYKLIPLFLRDFKAKLTWVKSGREAVLYARKIDYDLILMDCEMPELNGFDATVQIRESERKGKRRVPILAVTAHAFVQNLEKCLDSGMDDCVTKPINIQELNQKIAKLIFQKPN